MSTIHMHQTTTSTPEQYIAGLTDFGPGRSKLFGNSTDGYLKVHQKGSRDADVTEGSSGIWERLHPREDVCKQLESHRSPELRGRRRRKNLEGMRVAQGLDAREER